MIIPENRDPIHPGEILQKDFLDEMGITQAELAKRIGVTRQTINQLVSKKTGMTGGLAWKLSKEFGTTPEFWMNLHILYELAANRPKPDDD